MSQFVAPKKQKIWKNIIFFTLITLVTVIGGPLYLWKYGITPFEIALTSFFMVATGMGITVGYHRLFSHQTFQAHPIIQFIFLFFGAAAFEQSALEWSSQHRDHHRYVDTEKDPYSIKKGFWYAHLGWLVFWKHTFDFTNAPDLQKNPLVMHQNKYYHAWAFATGVITPVLIGALGGHALGAFIWAVCFRLVFVYNATFCINSVCHMFGNATYDIDATAKDHWLIALITNGEGYHNFHHRFPSDYRNGVRWYHWDPSKWLIKALSWTGLVYNLKKVSNFRIIEARLAAENQRVRNWATQHHDVSNFESAYQKFHNRYESLRQCLVDWEKASKEHQGVFYEKLTDQTKLIKEALFEKVQATKKVFLQERQAWRQLTEIPLTMAA